MDKQTACRKLAEALEPKPTWKNQPLYLSPSDLGFWYGYFSSNGVPEACRPFDPFTYETDSAKLLEAMKQEEPLLTWNADRQRWEFYLVRGGHWEDAEEMSSHAEKRDSIVLAALKWQNIEGEIDD